MTQRPATSESRRGVAPGTKGRAKARLPRGTMTVDATNRRLAEPNLRDARRMRPKRKRGQRAEERGRDDDGAERGATTLT